jgi:radical SAM superfamily enzyme YgiQ (UPF0313 family)
MKILLVYPYFLEQRFEEENISAIPMGLYYIGALLRTEGFDVEILNFYNDAGNPEKIRKILSEKRADVIGVSVFNANRWGGIEVARLAKEVNPAAKVVFGGVAATFLWEHLLRHFKEIDYVVLGEGEYTFLNLIRLLERNAEAEAGVLKGIAFRRGAEIIRTEPADQIQDLDQLPNPARYFAYQHVSLTRGCPGNCTFCGSPQFWGHKVRFHSSGYFVDQLELLIRRGVTFFYFSDDIFTMRKDLAITVCKEIVNRGLDITWYAISHVNNVDEEVLYWMRKAGCIQISFGVESGSEKIRKRLNKNLQNERVRRAFSLTTRYGILARAYIIYACPGESADTIRETEDLIREIKPLSVLFYVLRVFPGTALYSEIKERLQITDDVWLNPIEDILYLEADPEMAGDEVLQYRDRLRKAFHEGIPSFVDAIELEDIQEFYPAYADFLSRLAMTFSHGDYAGIEVIPDKEKIAAKLYERSLSYYPDHRAYLGLGIIRQKNHKYRDSISILEEGVRRFPDSKSLHVCLGISHMNLGEYDKALSALIKFQDSPEAIPHIAACYRGMGEEEKAVFFLSKLHK